MTKYEVVDIIAREHLVDRIVTKLLSSSKNPFDCPEDLIQDIYLLLLQKDDNLIVNLYNKDEIAYYLLRVVRNQLLSKNSPYKAILVTFFTDCWCMIDVKSRYPDSFFYKMCPHQTRFQDHHLMKKEMVSWSIQNMKLLKYD